jgi:hypothetical protein
MTRQQFTHIAGIIARMPAGLRDACALHFAAKLEDAYPMFRRDLFLAACGYSLPVTVTGKLQALEDERKRVLKEIAASLPTPKELR